MVFATTPHRTLGQLVSTVSSSLTAAFVIATLDYNIDADPKHRAAPPTAVSAASFPTARDNGLPSSPPCMFLGVLPDACITLPAWQSCALNLTC